MVLMGFHLLQSLILKAIAKCAVFSGDLSWIGEGYMDKIFYEAVKIILDLVKKIKLLFTLKLIPRMQKYLIFILI